jgi:hypothetical protein
VVLDAAAQQNLAAFRHAAGHLDVLGQRNTSELVVTGRRLSPPD